MPSTMEHHVHKATTKVAHKPFKGGKRRDRKGKTLDERPKTPHQQVMSKLDRRNQNRQRQLEKQKEQRLDASIFAGRDGAPRNVAVIPLCNNCDAATAVRALNASLDIEVHISAGPVRVPIDRFKQQLQYIVVPSDRDVVACLDAARVADFVVFVISAVEEVDERGELILRSVESQGLTTLFTAVHGLSSVESAKQRTSVLESLKSFMRHFHPDQEKLFSLENRQECANLMRSLCGATPKGIHWREERSWMLVEDVQFGTTGDDAAAVLTGVVRGKGLSADRLIHVGDWGSFQIDRITAAPLSARKPKSGTAADGMALDGQESGSETVAVLAEASEDRDDLDGLAPEEAFIEQDDEMEDDEADNQSLAAPSRKGVLLDDHHYFDDDDENQIRPAKKLPKGTSAYQSAWILDDVTSESGSDNDDDDNHHHDKENAAGENGKAEPADGMEGLAHDAQTEGAGPSEYPQSEVYVEQNEEQEAEQLAMYRQQKRGEAEDDLEFPDEIELHPQVLARERLARYRGLKSLRSSPWNAKEDRPHEPEDWRRLLQIHDYKSSRIRAAREVLVGGVAAGTRVAVHLAKGVLPEAVRAAYSPSRPAVAFSLLRHENKQTVVNLLINLSADHPRSIKSKEEFIVQCGPRRFVVNPLFSQSGNTPNDVHKFCRFVHPGQSAVASFVGPVTWGFVPTLFFKRAKSSTVPLLPGIAAPPPLQLAGIGTSLAPSTSRVVAKRVVLTGHPFHIHKKVVTIRYMFFNREDVEWFKALPLWTKRGRSGYIKESLGTHGYFKATFDGRINPQDSIGVSLYKRVWPRKSMLYQEWAAPPAEKVTEEAQAADEAMDEDMT